MPGKVRKPRTCRVKARRDFLNVALSKKPKGNRIRTAIYAAKSMCELGMNLSRIRRMAEQTEADAWVVVAGPRDVLEWFAARDTPAFALFGRLLEVPLARSLDHLGFTISNIALPIDSPTSM
jgi:hypothetical protein